MTRLLATTLSPTLVGLSVAAACFGAYGGLQFVDEALKHTSKRMVRFSLLGAAVSFAVWYVLQSTICRRSGGCTGVEGAERD